MFVCFSNIEHILSRKCPNCQVQIGSFQSMSFTEPSSIMHNKLGDGVEYALFSNVPITPTCPKCMYVLKLTLFNLFTNSFVR